jgi:hypothetical protein
MSITCVVSCLLGVSLSSAAVLAQPGSPAAPSPSSTPSAIDLLMPAAVEARFTPELARASVEVDGKLQGLIDDLLQRSPAFRRQWQRLLCVARLSVRIELVHAQRVLDAHAATSVSTLPDGSRLAVVAIPGGPRLAELVAHEVEHILERIDGARVASQHASGDSSVRRAGTTGTFETARAVFVGQMVAKELRPR